MHNGIQIISDPFVAQVDRGAATVPADWSGRALYRGAVGASNWLSVVDEPTYALRSPQSMGLAAMRHAALCHTRVSTLLSLGPGNAASDVELIEWLVGQDETANPSSVTYIPVDLSRSLLMVAIDKLRTIARIPAAVLCDFERGTQLLGRVLRESATPPVLFSLLGGTLSNLDRGERSFLLAVRPLMGEHDGLLLDIPLAGPAWDPEHEPRLHCEGYTRSFRRFVEHGATAHSASLGNDNGAGIGQSRDGFDERFEFAYHTDLETSAHVVTVRQRASGRSVLTFKRYRWEPLLLWLESLGFQVAYAESTLRCSTDRFGMGVVLLKAGPTLGCDEQPKRDAHRVRAGDDE